MTSKHKYRVGDKVWLDAHDSLHGDGTVDHWPRMKAVLTESLPDREEVPWARFCRIRLIDGPPEYLEYYSGVGYQLYTVEDALSRRFR